MPTRGFADEVPDSFECGGVPRSDAGVQLGAGGRHEVSMGVDRAAVFPAGRLSGFVAITFEVEREVQG